MSSATFYKWKATYGGMDVSQARKLKVPEDENARLKRLLGDAMLDNAVMKVVASKTGEACRSPKGCRGCATGLRHQRASGELQLLFTRPLKAGLRPVATGDFVCPVDGAISQFGLIDDHHMLQAKGHRFTTTDLVGGDDALDAQFRHGSFANL